MTLNTKIEALLFWKGEPIAISKIASLLKVEEAEVTIALAELEQVLEKRGVVLVLKEDEVMLGTAPELGPLFETIVKEEQMSDLSKASLETLTIILYRGPIAKQEIDYIRGINSNFILRSLLVRGLVERVENPKDRRSFLYKPTFDLLSHLGIQKIENLPEYEAVSQEINQLETEPEKEEMEKNIPLKSEQHG